MTGNARGFASRYGPWAVIAGASEGIGAAFARGVAERGANVALVARRSGPLEAVARALSSEHGIEARTVATDLADPEAADRVLEAVSDVEVGLLVHNAAASAIGPFLDTPLEEHRKALAVNASAPLALIHSLAGPMRARGRGGIVVVSSLAAFQGSPLVASYAATKAFGLVLAEGLWDELRGAGVDVLACCAGATRTPGYGKSAPRESWLFAPGPLDPAFVAEAALFALGRGPVCIPGSANRLTSFVFRRLLPRRTAVAIMGRATRRLYGPTP